MNKLYMRNPALITALKNGPQIIPYFLNRRNFYKATIDVIPDTKKAYDVLIVGGGIVGTATARNIVTKYPKVKVALVEKEKELSLHQTSHNSGVIHAGIYYKPGSLKAKLCVRGMALMYKYLDEKRIPYSKVGKLIVAVDESEICGLQTLYERSVINKVPDVRLVSKEEIAFLEPNVTGVRAIHSPHTGICDYIRVAHAYANDFMLAKGDIYLNYEVNRFILSDDPFYPVGVVAKDGRIIKTKHVLACAGLQSDYVAVMAGASKHPRIVPFRGEYLVVDKGCGSLINGNVYPVPDPRFPFLGVHFSKRMDGSTCIGPNAVIAFAREGYRATNVSVQQLTELCTNVGLMKIGLLHTKMSIGETMKSTFLFLKKRELRRYIAEIDNVVLRKAPAWYGVRAQAITANGDMVDDFLFDLGVGEPGRFILNCRNAPSPGATSSLSIAEMITEKLNEMFYISSYNE